jgi:hypothetical protein
VLSGIGLLAHRGGKLWRKGKKCDKLFCILDFRFKGIKDNLIL